MSMRPKIPAMRTVTADSSPRSGVSLTASTGTLAVPIVSSRIWAMVRCFVPYPHDDGDCRDGQASAHEHRRQDGFDLRIHLRCGEDHHPHFPSRRRASNS